MADASQAPKTLRERIKLGLIPMLGATLLAVMKWQDETPGNNATISVAAPSESGSVSPVTLPRSRMDSISSRRQDWPIIPLDQVLAYNPFAFPEALRPDVPTSPVATEAPLTSLETESAHRQDLQEKWESAPMTTFYRSPNGPVAIVGSQVLHEGDVVEGDLRVIEIRPDGITYGISVP